MLMVEPIFTHSHPCRFLQYRASPERSTIDGFLIPQAHEIYLTVNVNFALEIRVGVTLLLPVREYHYPVWSCLVLCRHRLFVFSVLQLPIL